MAKLFNRAWHDTTTTGTGTITLGGARTGYATFAEAGVADADVVSYTIIDGNDFEIGIGTYTSAGTTLSRTTVALSKIAGVSGTSKINLSGGANVFIAARKEDLLSITETQTANRVFAGPTSGGAAAPTFRALVHADFPTTSVFQTGVKSLFVQTSAPTGWTKDTDQNDKALRIVSGTASTGGSSAFSTVFGLTATDATTISTSTMPAHTHAQATNTYTDTAGASEIKGTDIRALGGTTGSAGSGGSHTHGMDIRVQYVDVIKATKD